MKTTLELPDDLFREVKARAARRGIALREFVRQALTEKVAREEPASFVSEHNTKRWPVPPPDVPREEIRRIQELIDEEFEQIDSEDGV